MRWLGRVGALWAILLGTLSIEGRSSGAPEGVWGRLMPRRATQAASFVEEHPEYDGRGVVVAIFDNGVDLSAAGLQTTSDGKPKILDVIDATGSGDVDMSERREVGEGFIVEGLDGRDLTLSSDWRIPTKEVRLGAKPAEELFPGAIKSDVRAYIRRSIEPEHLELVERLRDELEELDAQADSDARGELEIRLEKAVEEWDQFQPVLPIYDIVTFHDGDEWRAVVDTDSDGNLEDETVLSEFTSDRAFGTFGFGSNLHFAAHFYDDGDTLSLVVNSGDHGTHVAGIVSGYWESNPELNGVAPGAQIISVNIGDSRLGAMETNTAIERGLRAAMDHGVDLINMSYSEPSSTPNRGRLLEAIRTLSREGGVTYVSSAANSGPGLSTVGAPGGVTTEVIGVGAVVTPEMARSQYGYSAPRKTLAYTWSSRGPTWDGDWGVDIVAPGGAFSPVPVWTGARGRRMNGTSMSSPNACGALALVVSGWKAEGVAVSPLRIRRGLGATARPVDGLDPVDQGAGMIQVDDLYQWGLKTSELGYLDVPIEVDAGGGARGALLEGKDFDKPVLRRSVRLRPYFDEAASQEERWAYLFPIAVESDADWLEAIAPDVMASDGASVALKVHTERLEPGASFGTVSIFHRDYRNHGPVARIPVSALVPEPVSLRPGEPWTHEMTLEPGSVERFFLNIPAGITSANITWERIDESEESARIAAHIGRRPLTRDRRTNSELRYLNLESNAVSENSIELTGGSFLEFAVSGYWSNEESARIRLELKPQSLIVTPGAIVFDTAGLGSPLRVTPQGVDARLSLRGRIDTVSRIAPPVSSEIDRLDKRRDLTVDAYRNFGMTLVYSFNLDKNASVWPRFIGLEERLYEADLFSGLWSIEDENGRRWGFDDTLPGGGSAYTRLDAGTYSLRLRLRHPDRSVLEALQETPIRLDMRLKDPMNVSFYSDPEDRLMNKNEIRDLRVSDGEPSTLFPALNGALSQDMNRESGRLWTGSALIGDKTLPIAFSPDIHEDHSGGDEELESESEFRRRMKESQDALRLERLSALREAGEREAFEEYVDELEKKKRLAARALYQRLLLIDDKDRKERLEEIMALCDEILAEFPEEPEAESDRLLVARTLYRQLRAIAYRDDARTDADPTAALSEEFEEGFERLKELVDTKEPEFLLVHLRSLRRLDKQGEALKILDEQSSDLPREIRFARKRERLLEELGWEFWLREQRRQNRMAYPDWEYRF